MFFSCIPQHVSAYVSIRHTSAYAAMWAYALMFFSYIPQHASAYTFAYVHRQTDRTHTHHLWYGLLGCPWQHLYLWVYSIHIYILPVLVYVFSYIYIGPWQHLCLWIYICIYIYICICIYTSRYIYIYIYIYI
jgi:hypothetical protein